MTALTAAIGFTDTEQGRIYTAWLIPEDGLTDGDDRLYVGPIGWRAERIPLTFSDVEGEPHEEARHVGNIDNLRREMRDGESWLVGDVDWDTDELATEAKRLVDEDRLRGISVHPTEGDGWMICGVPDNPTADSIEALAQEFDMETCEMPIMAFTNVVVGAATLLLLPAFEDAEVVVAADTVTKGIYNGEDVTESVTITQPVIDFNNLVFDNKIVSDGKPWVITIPREDADAIGVLAALDLKKPPADWFIDPGLTEPTPLTIDEEGRVFGHLALWDTCHRGFADTCVTPPRDATEYQEFHDNARLMTDDGALVQVGCLTFDVSHADVRASADTAKRHYDHSGTVAAFVRAGQDNIGVWLAGAVKPGLSDDQIEMMRRLSLSGDWRPKGGSYFLIAAQAVPVPGFPIRARVASGIQISLTTVGPNQPDAIAAAVHEMGTEALIAAAIGKLDARLDFIVEWIREQERREAYARAMTDLGATE